MSETRALPSSLRHSEHQQLFEYWRSKCRGDLLAGRRDIDPVDLRQVLPRLALIDVLREADGLDFRYRLTGTEIVERAGRDPTRKRFTELYDGDYLEAALATYRTVAEEGVPMLSERTFPLVRDREFLRYDRLILPLAADGRTVDMVMLLIAVLEHVRMDEI